MIKGVAYVGRSHRIQVFSVFKKKTDFLSYGQQAIVRFVLIHPVQELWGVFFKKKRSSCSTYCTLSRSKKIFFPVAESGIA
jgi:hypothetical protein